LVVLENVYLKGIKAKKLDKLKRSFKKNVWFRRRLS